jgi:ABC-type branched-subunit amino acid transport system permease subunit
VLGPLIDGKTLTYWLIFAVVGVLFVVLLRIVNSPFGRVLLDILLIVVIGGMGTLYGAVIGSVLFVLFVLSVYYFPSGVVGRWWARA